MSVLSTVTIKKSDALLKIAQIVGVCQPFDDYKETDNRMIADILRRLTEGNTHYEFQDNNFCVVENDYQARDHWETVYPDSLNKGY